MLIITITLVFGLCFCIFNFLFQRDKYARYMDDEKKKLNKLNSPIAWLIYSIILFLGIIILIGYIVYQYYMAVFKLY